MKTKPASVKPERSGRTPPPRIRSVAEVLASKERFGKRDNEWVYRRNRSLVHRETGYDVDLDLCESSAAVLDWLFQVLGKSWCTGKTIRDLMIHLRVRVDPQATLCSWGGERGKAAGL